MLYRETTQRKIAITQPAHAWLSGQLARAWGNAYFGDVVPWEEVCLGAEQHDVGHIPWEQAPRLNPQTGLPYSFIEMPRQWHVQLWASAARLVLPQGRYASLLVSLHGTGLYESYDAATDTPENAWAVRDYLAQERTFQEDLLTSLRADPHYRVYATQEVVTRNRRLLRVWDALSLAICSGGWRTQSFSHVPTATSSTSLTLTARDGDATNISVTPWPFRHEQVSLVYEGRLLSETFSDEARMREALQHAPWVTMQSMLFPKTNPFAIVQAWQEAANTQNVERLLELSDPNIEMVGPRGSGFGHQLLREWIARAGLTLETLRVFMRDKIVVVEQHGEWRSLDSSELSGEKTLASVFQADDEHIVKVARYDSLNAALEVSGLDLADETALLLPDHRVSN